MKVNLLTFTPNPEQVIAAAARQCYSKGFVGDYYLEECTASAKKSDDEILKKVISMNHLSVLEHASFTFAVGDVSRSLTHQLVRFRIASFSQQSQRYVKAGLSFKFVTPPSIADTPNERFFTEMMDTLADAYANLVESGVPVEDARFVLPNACCTHIVMTMNARELLHAFSLRCCIHAQWEIRSMFNTILEQVKHLAPTVFKDAGANCVRGFCTERERSCKSNLGGNTK